GFGGMGEMLKGLLPKRPVRKRMTVKEAREVLKNQHAERLIDKEELKEEARRRAQEDGIVFIDEIDKVARREGTVGPD
ncbi:AAA family ATPase, partial [Staphylococcus aureus]|nr:AAA family ATPase [Staphylococcus aureus]